MVSTNLNPGRKVLKVKPAEKCIIKVLRSTRGEDILLPLTFLTHCLPAQPEIEERQVGRRATGILFLTTSHSLPHSFTPSPSQCIPNQSAGGAMLVKKPQPFECLLYLQTEACWNQRHYHMT